ncbi:hypothetical protein K502DRAFT_363649 [Neoconidiobolus thromboides FSU 785]|nr:hypothetical protein K502DRAFT_363649 [Neoconidiobolus thromboides FSU 785]
MDAGIILISVLRSSVGLFQAVYVVGSLLVLLGIFILKYDQKTLKYQYFIVGFKFFFILCILVSNILLLYWLKMPTIEDVYEVESAYLEFRRQVHIKLIINLVGSVIIGIIMGSIVAHIELLANILLSINFGLLLGIFIGLLTHNFIQIIIISLSLSGLFLFFSFFFQAFFKLYFSAILGSLLFSLGYKLLFYASIYINDLDDESISFLLSINNISSIIMLVIFVSFFSFYHYSKIKRNDEHSLEPESTEYVKAKDLI